MGVIGVAPQRLRKGRTIVEPRTLEDLKVCDIFRAPSRTLTDAHATAFQAVSADNHPIHYEVEYATSYGHAPPVVHGLQVFAFTAPDLVELRNAGVASSLGGTHLRQVERFMRGLVRSTVC